ncbi:hypothetical protein WCE37_01000 [Luteimonas sp. MJ250]|uniref:hypothetical protein n=1 Tax=Luteimonas sp. MJ250 TaxID=3129236 RepID=UPI0031BAEE1F
MEIFDWWAENACSAESRDKLLVLVSPAVASPRQWSGVFPPALLLELFVQTVQDVCIRAVGQNRIASSIALEYAQYQSLAVALAFDENRKTDRPDAIDVLLACGIGKSELDDLIRVNATRVWPVRSTEAQCGLIQESVREWFRSKTVKLPKLMIVSIGLDDEEVGDDLDRLRGFFGNRKMGLKYGGPGDFGKSSAGVGAALVTESAVS